MATPLSTISPHVVVGVEPDLPRRDIDEAYARALKRLRNHPDPPFTREELNSALDALTNPDEDRSSFQTLQVSIDPGLYVRPKTIETTWLLQPRNLARRTNPFDDRELLAMAQDTVDSHLQTLEKDLDAALDPFTLEAPTFLGKGRPVEVSPCREHSWRPTIFLVVLFLVSLAMIIGGLRWNPPATLDRTPYIPSASLRAVQQAEVGARAFTGELGSLQ